MAILVNLCDKYTKSPLEYVAGGYTSHFQSLPRLTSSWAATLCSRIIDEIDNQSQSIALDGNYYSLVIGNR